MRAGPWLVAALVGLVGLLVYANSIPNGFVLDDRVVIQHNPHVQRGIAGIPGILTSDSFDTGLNADDIAEAAGGRYRPLSLITFAIERSLIPLLVGTKYAAQFHHLSNVLLFTFSLMLLVFLVRALFPESTFIPLVTGLLFAVHPVHAEVVANIKSRDEILCLLLLSASLLTFLRLAKTRGNLGYALAWLLLFGGLLAKEYALAALLLVPLATYLCHGWNSARFGRELFTVGSAIAVYAIWRAQVVGFGGATATDPLNAPFTLLEPAEALGTKLALLGKSLRYTLFPNPLSCDYGFAALPSRSLAHPLVWAGLASHLLIGIAALWTTIKRHPIAFAFWFYLLTLFPISNLLVDVGIPFAERFLYHASFGVCLFAAWALSRFASATWLRVALTVLLIVAGLRTAVRNQDWASNRSLILKDVQTVPRSVSLQQKAGVMLYNDGKFDEAIKALDACTDLYPQYGEPYPIRCLAHTKAGNFEDAIRDFQIAKQLWPPKEIETYRTFIATTIRNTPASTPDEEDAKDALIRKLK